METLMSSSAKLLSDKYRREGWDRAFLCPRNALSRPEYRFFRPTPKFVNVGFSLSISLRHKMIHPLFSVSCQSLSDTQIDVQNEETQTEDINQSRTIHVKFQLQRECTFGQHFLIVGDDPIFGLWDPSNAVPLNWSDGHVWTVELDIPIGKSIKFKFILKAGTEDILWQPGPDRILQTWETTKMITVCEDWDNTDLQKIIEEEPMSNQNEGSTTNPEMLIVAENLTPPRGSQTTDVIGDSTITNSIAKSMKMTLTDTPMAMVAENITDPKKKFQVNTNKAAPGARTVTYANEGPVAISNKDMTTGGSIFGNNGRAVNVKDLESTKDEESLASHEGVPVLVPGLTPLPTVHTEEASPNEVDKNIFADASIGANKAKGLNVPELDLKEEPHNESPHQKETTEMPFNDKQELHQNEQLEKLQLATEQDQPKAKLFHNSVLESDIQWGRKTLQKLLNNFGFR